MKNIKKTGVIFAIILLSSCSGGQGGDNKNNAQIENAQYPLASQKNILLVNPQSASIDNQVDTNARIQRDKNCKLKDPSEVSDINSIINIYGNLLAAANANTGYSYQYEIILAQTKDLIDKYSCYFPEIYLANANILLRLSEIPTDLLNSENRFIESKALSSQGENNLVNQVQTSDDLKYSKFSKLNSTIREVQTAAILLQDDSEENFPFTRISSVNATGQSINLFDSEFSQNGASDSDKYAESSVYANYLLAKAHYERALYRLQGIVASDDLYNKVDTPNDLFLLGSQSSVREIIVEDLKESKVAASQVYSSTFCAANSLNAHLPAHMSTMCGDLKNIFGNDLSVVSIPLESLPLDTNYSQQLGRLVCSADSRYTLHSDETKFCQNFLTQFPSAKNANLNKKGVPYASVNSWALNLAGVTQHLSYLDSELTNVVNNITQNKDSILNTLDINKKLDELTAQKTSLTSEIAVANSEITTVQDNAKASTAAVNSAKSAVSALQNELLSISDEQANLFRDYLSSIRKEQYISLLFNTLADKQTAVQNFKNEFSTLSKSSSDTLNNVLTTVKKEWEADCSQSLLNYNHNIDLLNTYNCIIKINPHDYWKDKSKWNDVNSVEYSNQWAKIALSITDTQAGACQAVAIAAAYARESQLALYNADSSQVPYVKDSNNNTVPAWYSYAVSLSTLYSEQQDAKDSMAQILAVQSQYAFKYGIADTTQKFDEGSIALKQKCDDFIDSDSSSYSEVKEEIIQNDISTAAQSMSNQITIDSIVQDQTSLQNNLADIKTQIQQLATKLSLDPSTRNKYEKDPSVVFNYSQSQVDSEVSIFSNTISSNSPAVKSIQDQIAAANFEVSRAQSLLDSANSQINTAKLSVLSIQTNIDQITAQIQNWDITKNSFVYTALEPSQTSYFNKEYLLSDAQESAQSVLKVLAYRTMNFNSGDVTGQNYASFLKLLDVAQLQCHYFASFGDAEKCVLSLRSILDPNVAKVNFGLYGNHTEILPIQIYSDDYYSLYSDVDKRTAQQAQMNNQIIQDLRVKGYANLPLNTLTLAMEFDQGATPGQIFKEFGMQRVVGISLNIIKKDETNKKDVVYSQDQNKSAVLRDGLNDSSSQQADCSQAAIYASTQAQNTKQILSANNFDVRLQNLMSPDIMTNVICQKSMWVEKQKTDSIPDLNLLEQTNTADTYWIFDLKNKTNHDYRPFFTASDGAWNRVSGIVSPDPQSSKSDDYNNVMLGCLNDAIQNPTASNLNLVRCNASPVTSTIDFTNIAGKSLMGNWNLVYGEYGADNYDYNAETQSGKVLENDKTRIVGLNVVFYIIKN